MTIEVHRPQIQHGLGARDAPAHPRPFHPVLYQMAAGALSHAAADRIPGREVLIVMHEPPIPFQVADHRTQLHGP